VSVVASTTLSCTSRVLLLRPTAVVDGPRIKRWPGPRELISPLPALAVDACREERELHGLHARGCEALTWDAEGCPEPLELPPPALASALRCAAAALGLA